MSRLSIPISMISDRINFSRFQNTSITSRYHSLRPLTDFFDFKRVSRPENLSEAQSRISFNIGHFSSNYTLVFVLLSIYTVFQSGWLMFAICYISVGTWVIGRLNGQDLEIGNFRATTTQLWTGLIITSIPVLLASGLFSAVFFLLGLSGFIILGHAAMLEKPIENAFNPEEAV